MSEPSGQRRLRVLRDTRERLVLLCERGGQPCVTRLLRTSHLPSHFSRTVRHAAVEGKGSFASLGDDIAMTLEGYAVAARVLGEAGEPPVWPRVVDAGVTGEGLVFVSTTWIEGTPLHELSAPLDTLGRMRATDAMLDVLVALHDRGVAHGDLKLANLVLRPDGGVALIDLDTLREVPGADVGAPTRDRTESWAAPEQLERHETWFGSDVWALGRVLVELWGDALPVHWRPALDACRASDPAARPTARSLRAHLADPAEPLVDSLGRACVVGGAGSAGTGSGGTTERVPDRPVGGATERVAEPAVGGATERVADTPSGPSGQGVGPGWRPVTPGPVRVPNRKPDGCAGLLLGLSKAALAAAVLGGIALCGAGALIDGWIRNAADQEAEGLFAELKVHKTDPKKNEKEERDRLALATADLWDRHETPRTCAARALALVWQQRWHFDADWSAADFEAASVAVNQPLCVHEPEAALAKATLYAGACRRRTAGVVSPTDCQVALSALEPFWTALPPGEEAHWLRVEAAWQEVRARSALVGRYVETGNAEAAAVGSAALARCREAEVWMGYAPVNALELQEECLVVAGYVGDIDAYLHFADLRLASLPTERKRRAGVLRHLYTAAGLGCVEAKYGYNRRSAPVVTGPAWCVALGDVARGCPAAASATLASPPAGDTHPWASLRAAAAARSGPCLE